MENKYVVISTNSHYAAPAAVSARSALMHGDDDISVIVYYCGSKLDSSFKKIEETFIYDKVSIEVINPIIFSDLPDKQYFGNDAVYVRLFLGTLLDNSFKRIVYLDADTLVYKNISNLWDESLDGMAIGAVREMHGPVAGHRGGMKNWKEAGVPAEAPYFNSGVLAIDLDMWREEEIEKKCLNFIERFNKTIRFPDQDSLNAVFCNQWKEFAQNYNVSSFWDNPKYPVEHFGYGNVLEDIRIFHFQGPDKPWHDDYSNKHRKNMYNNILMETAWA